MGNKLLTDLSYLLCINKNNILLVNKVNFSGPAVFGLITLSVVSRRFKNTLVVVS